MKASKNAFATLRVSTVTRRCVGAAAWGRGFLCGHTATLLGVAQGILLNGLLLLTKQLKYCCGETLKQANRIILICMGPTMDPSMDQKVSELMVK